MFTNVSLKLLLHKIYSYIFLTFIFSEINIVLTNIIIFKVKSISGQVHGQGKKRKLVIKFARRLLRMKKETLPQRLNVCLLIIFTVIK